MEKGCAGGIDADCTNQRRQRNPRLWIEQRNRRPWAEMLDPSSVIAACISHPGRKLMTTVSVGSVHTMQANLGSLQTCGLIVCVCCSRRASLVFFPPLFCLFFCFPAMQQRGTAPSDKRTLRSYSWPDPTGLSRGVSPENETLEGPSGAPGQCTLDPRRPDKRDRLRLSRRWARVWERIAVDDLVLRRARGARLGAGCCDHGQQQQQTVTRQRSCMR